MSKSTPRLGKGLSALIGPRSSGPFRRSPSQGSSALAELQQREQTALHEIRLDRISPNPRQPRATIGETALEELAQSIRQSGVLQPVLVRHAGDGSYELVAGERRWRAARLAGLETIPAIVRELTDSESFEAALIENLQREDLSPIERATAYQQLIDTTGESVDAVATRLGESRANVSNYLRLLKLNEEIRQMIQRGELGMGQARACAGISNPQRQLALARLAARRNLSVRQVEALAHAEADLAERTPRSEHAIDPHLTDLARTLSKALGMAVALRSGRKKNSGRVVIRYNSLEDFDRIAERICGRPLME